MFSRATPQQQIAILLFDGVNMLDVAGPAEAFASVRAMDGSPAYLIRTMGLDAGIVRTESNLALVAEQSAEESNGADLLIVPGGRGIREPKALHGLAGWLTRHHESFARIASICTGAYALAEAGLLDGRRVTTHWAHAADLKRRYPRVEVTSDALFLGDGRFFSSGGVTAGIDLALDLIERDHGAHAAMAVARELVVYMRRTGSQAQFSAPLRLQQPTEGHLADVCLWAANNLDGDLSVERLAERANLSVRQFTRRFTKAFGTPPAQHLRNLRLDVARTALADPSTTLERVANASGFRSLDGFRRAFQQRFGLCPGDYRRRFQPQESFAP